MARDNWFDSLRRETIPLLDFVQKSIHLDPRQCFLRYDPKLEMNFLPLNAKYRYLIACAEQYYNFE